MFKDLYVENDILKRFKNLKYTVLIMNTSEYRLKSDPKKSVEVPENYAVKAEKLIKIAKVSPSTLSDSISDHPYLTNIGVLSRTVQLAVLNRNEPESVNLPKLEDEVYLRVCIYGIERQMELKSNFEELHSKYRELTGIVECLR